MRLTIYIQKQTNKSTKHSQTSVQFMNETNPPVVNNKQFVVKNKHVVNNKQSVVKNKQNIETFVNILSPKHSAEARGCRSLAGSRRLGCYRFGGGAQSAKFAYD